MEEEKHELTKIEEIKLPEKDWSKELKLVKEITAKNCNTTEFKLLLFMAQQYDLNPLKKEIFAIKYQNHPAMIMVSRDGFLNIAHKSGKFGAMKTTFEFETKKNRLGNDVEVPKSATCRIWRKDFDKPFEVTVYAKEYMDWSKPIWKAKPATMLGKVAESQCLRRAFNISGMYEPSEMDNSGLTEKKDERKDEDIQPKRI